MYDLEKEFISVELSSKFTLVSSQKMWIRILYVDRFHYNLSVALWSIYRKKYVLSIFLQKHHDKVRKVTMEGYAFDCRSDIQNQWNTILHISKRKTIILLPILNPLFTWIEHSLRVTHNNHENTCLNRFS